MRKILWVFFIGVYVTGMLAAFGVIRFSHAEHEIMHRNLGSDLEIELTLHKYGFDLAWHEKPSVINYITSNFK